MNRLIGMTAGIACLALVLGCSGGDDEPEIPPPAGNQVRLSLLAAPETIDPHLASVISDYAVAKQLFRGLFAYDEDLDLVPAIATAIPTSDNGGISADGLVYTIKLRGDVKWSDGQPLSAGDFEYSFKRLLDPSLESFGAFSFYDIRGAEKFNSCYECSDGELAQLRDDVGVIAQDDSTLVITLATPRITLPHLLTILSAAPVRRDVIEQHGDEWTAAGNLVGNGPFALSSMDGNEIVLVPNPNWWGDPVTLDRVTIKIISDPAEAFSKYLAGELDAVELSPELLATVEADPKLRRQHVEQPSLSSTAYFFNQTKPPFDNDEVRQAFAMAVDREAFATEVEAGTTSAAFSWLPEGMPGHNGKLGEQWTFDPEAARRLLAEAGYPEGRGLPEIAYAYGTVGRNAEYAEFLQAQLQANLGVSISLQPMEITDWRPLFFGGELQIMYLGWAAEYADPEVFLSDLWTCQRYEGDTCTAYSGNNLFQYANPEFDRLMQLAAKESDSNRRLRYYGDAEEVLVGDAPAIFMTSGVRHLLVKPYLGGVVHTPLDATPMEFFLDRIFVRQ